MPNIQAARLIGDQRRLSEFGRYKTGVHRPTYSVEDMAARHWLEGMEEAACEQLLTEEFDLPNLRETKSPLDELSAR